MLIISRGDQVPCQYDKSSDNNIFYGKKVQEIKKKTDMLPLQLGSMFIYAFFYLYWR